jgi:hypothetical protein
MAGHLKCQILEIAYNFDAGQLQPFIAQATLAGN